MMEYSFLGNTSGAWLSALGIAIAVTLGLRLARGVLQRRLATLAARTSNRIDDIAVDMVGATRLLAMVVLGLYAGATVLVLDPGTQLFLTRVAIVTALVQAALWGDAGVRAWLSQSRAERETDPARATSTAALAFIARVFLWAVITLMILDNLGFNITALVASLGIGGIAVALAVQNILGDLFASLSIVLDKPFVIGDFIRVDDRSGTVEYVGLKTTRVRSLGGEEIIFSNADLLGSRIHNFKRMETRRVVLTIGVEYGTPEDELRRIPGLIEQIVRARDNVTFDRAHFLRFGPSSLDFEVVYIVNNADYLAHMDIQQEINYQLYSVFGERGIGFAFPTQTLHIAGLEQGLERAAGRIAPLPQKAA
ncbi:MAG TPA: mechanosensitive ion channel family protein [Telluria sp.]